MDLEKHFEGYRHFVKKDVLEGYADHAKVFVLESGGNVAEELKKLKREIELEAARGNLEEYNKLLKYHQQWLIEIFEGMVHSLYDYYVLVEKKLPEIAILDMAHLKGWNWFKFLHPVVISFDRLAVVPMHNIEKNKDLYEGLPVFDADEMKYMLADPVAPESVERILRTKMKAQKEGKILKLFLPEDHAKDAHFNDLETINNLSVVDWTREVAYVNH